MTATPKPDTSAEAMREADVSIFARSVRETLRAYGHNATETTLPEIIAADVVRALPTPASDSASAVPVNVEAMEPLRSALARLPDDTPDHARLYLDLTHGEGRAIRTAISTATVPVSVEAGEREAARVAEVIAADIERYGQGLVPEMAVVCTWLADHYRADNSTVLAALSTPTTPDTTASDSVSVDGEVERLRAEIANLRTPDLFWIDDDPEVGYLEPSEAIDEAGGYTERGNVVAIREGRTLGVTYWATLPAADDADTDDWWEQAFDSDGAAQEALNAEIARRASLTPGDQS